jgi:toxin ParE1/3/4
VKRVIVPAALAELHAASAFYATSADLELGIAFLAEFERCVNLVTRNPTAGSMFHGTARRYHLRRFPYSIVYQFDTTELLVIAVAHPRRRPGYWKGRD